MTKMLMLSMALAVTLGQPMLAADAIDQATQDKITAQLTAQGYEVRQITAEDGKIEVYAIKDGKKATLYLDETLKVVGTTEASN